MTEPHLRPTELVAAIDETAPFVDPGQTTKRYTLAAVVIDRRTALAGLSSVFGPGRSRPWHAPTEGREVMERMITLVAESARIHYASELTHRSAELQSRQRLLRRLALEVADVSEVVIEASDRATDERDRQTILSTFEERGGVPFAYRWASKQEPLTWLADAAAWAFHRSTLGDPLLLDRLESVVVSPAGS